jgi:ATP-binding cassette subfamily B protein
LAQLPHSPASCRWTGYSSATQAPDHILSRDALSGGERQRLGLLRACLRPRPLVAVFDEPTSALDSLTEERALRLVLANRQAAPVLLVAHRMSTVSHCDRVVVLRDGRIVEEGPPSVLRDQDGPYAALCRAELSP